MCKPWNRSRTCVVISSINFYTFKFAINFTACICHLKNVALIFCNSICFLGSLNNAFTYFFMWKTGHVTDFWKQPRKWTPSSHKNSHFFLKTMQKQLPQKIVVKFFNFLNKNFYYYSFQIFIIPKVQCSNCFQIPFNFCLNYIQIVCFFIHISNYSSLPTIGSR